MAPQQQQPDAAMAVQPERRSVRVCVRIRPQLPTDGGGGTTLLQHSPSRPCEVVLAAALAASAQQPQALLPGAAAKRYAFDAVFGKDTSQVCWLQ